MSRHFLPRLLRLVLMSFLAIVSCVSLSFAQARHQGKIFGGYFEEWGVKYGGYNIANLQKTGAADELTHLIYAFGNVTPTSPPACAIADPAGAYQNSTLPSVSGKPYSAPLYGNFGAIQQLKELHPNLKVLISLGGQAGDVAGFVTAAGTVTGRAALASSHPAAEPLHPSPHTTTSHQSFWTPVFDYAPLTKITPASSGPAAGSACVSRAPAVVWPQILTMPDRRIRRARDPRWPASAIGAASARLH